MSQVAADMVPPESIVDSVFDDCLIAAIAHFESDKQVAKITVVQQVDQLFQWSEVVQAIVGVDDFSRGNMEQEIVALGDDLEKRLEVGRLVLVKMRVTEDASKEEILF